MNDSREELKIVVFLMNLVILITTIFDNYGNYRIYGIPVFSNTTSPNVSARKI